MPPLPEEIIPPEERDMLQDQVVRDQEHYARDHQRAQHKYEDRIPAREAALSKGVSSQGVEEQLQNHYRYRDERAVQEPAP